MRYPLALLLSMFFLCTVSAQVGGERVFTFLDLSSSARQNALGGRVLTLTDDVNQPFWNPAVISEDLDRQLSVNYSSHLAGTHLGSLAYAHTFSRRFGTLHGGIHYLSYGRLIGADEAGNETGNFSASDVSISVGYALNLPWTNFYLGANVKLMYSTIATFSSSGIATDIALMYNSPYQPFVITLVARNIGSQLTSFNGMIEPLPFEVALGASYRLEHVPIRWHLTINQLQQWQVAVPNPSNQTSEIDGTVTPEKISFLDNTLRHVVLGLELFPESDINLRVGYDFRKSKELQMQNIRTFGGISFGFGLQMRKMKLNFAHAKTHRASNTTTFSLQFYLDR